MTAQGPKLGALVAIPELCRARAQHRGLPREKVDELWAKHFDWAARRGLDAGGREWDRFVDATVQRLNEEAQLRPVLTDAAAVRARREAEHQRARRASQEAYERAAVPFGAYLDSLVTKASLTATERLLLRSSRRHVAGCRRDSERECSMHGCEGIGTFLMRAILEPGKAADDEHG